MGQTHRPISVRIWLAGWLALLACLASGSPASAASKKEAPQDGPVFVRFEPIIVPVLEDNRVAGLMSVTVNLEVTSPADKDSIEAERVRYIDAFTRVLIQFGQVWADPYRPVNVNRMNAQLQQAASRIAGDIATASYVVDATVRATQ